MAQATEQPLFTPIPDRPIPQADSPIPIPDSPAIFWQLKQSASPGFLITISGKTGTGRTPRGTTHIIPARRWYGGGTLGIRHPSQEPDTYAFFHELAHATNMPEARAPTQAKSEERWTYMAKTLLIAQAIAITCAVLIGFCLTNAVYLAISNHYHLHPIATINLTIMAVFLFATATLSQKINLRNMKGVATRQ